MLRREILDKAQAYTEKLHNNMKGEVLEIQKGFTKASPISRAGRDFGSTKCSGSADGAQK